MKNFLLCLLLTLPCTAQAAEWKIIPEKSSIEFKATYGKDAVIGTLPKLDGEVSFDPQTPEKSHVEIRVDMTQIASDDKDALAYLPMAEWFASKQFPVSVFTVDEIKKLPGNQFEATGTLKLRDKTAKVLLPFTLEILPGDKGEEGKQFASMNGTAVIKRLAFGVGQGEWAKTDVIADDVALKIHLDAVTK